MPSTTTLINELPRVASNTNETDPVEGDAEVETVGAGVGVGSGVTEAAGDGFATTSGVVTDD